jgi:hypothetical protein
VEHPIKREEIDDVIKHWLLSLLVEHPVSLGLLFPVEQTQGLNVRAIPHCNSEDYLAGLSGDKAMLTSREKSTRFRQAIDL